VVGHERVGVHGEVVDLAVLHAGGLEAAGVEPVGEGPPAADEDASVAHAAVGHPHEAGCHGVGVGTAEVGATELRVDHVVGDVAGGEVAGRDAVVLDRSRRRGRAEQRGEHHGERQEPDGHELDLVGASTHLFPPAVVEPMNRLCWFLRLFRGIKLPEPVS